MFKNEIHCKKCNISFDGDKELQYLKPEKPCCPRCLSEDIVIFRSNWKIVPLKK